MMNTFCHHIGISTNHLPRLKKFYLDKLGFKLDSEMEIDKKIFNRIFGIEANCKMVKLRLGKLYLELFSIPRFKFRRYCRRATGYNHWAINVFDKVRFCRSLRQKGVEVIKIKRANHYTYFIKDLDGNVIEVRE